MAEFSAGASDDVCVHHAHLIDDHVVTIRPIPHFIRHMYVFFVVSALLFTKWVHPHEKVATRDESPERVDGWEIPSIASTRLTSAPLTATNVPIGSAIESSASTIQPSLSLMNPTAPMLGTIAVAAMTAPAAPSSLVNYDASDVTTDVKNQAAIAEALTRANHMLQSNRAENTKKAYDAKKKLWITWFRARKFVDGETVTEGKLCLYLQEEVFVNGNQAQRGGRRGTILSPQGVELGVHYLRNGEMILASTCLHKALWYELSNEAVAAMDGVLRLLRCEHHNKQYCWHDNHHSSPIQIIRGTRYICKGCKTPSMSFCSHCAPKRCPEHDLPLATKPALRWIELKSSAKYSDASDTDLSSEWEEVVCCPVLSRIENCRAINRAFIDEASMLKLSQIGGYGGEWDNT